MKPLLLASTVAPPIFAVVTVPAAAAAGLLLPAVAPEAGAELVPDELQATSTDAAAAAADSPTSARRRTGPFLTRRTEPSLRSGVLPMFTIGRPFHSNRHFCRDRTNCS